MDQTTSPERGPILVSHVGRRDSYELAYSLTLSGRSVHLVTDFYFQPGTLMGRLAQAIFVSGINKRYRPDLKVTVHSSALLFALDFVERIFPRNKIVNQLRGYALGRQCLRVARRHGVTDAYFYTNSGVEWCVRGKIRARITLFQMHPHADALVGIYRRYMDRRPNLATLLTSQEEELTDNRAYINRLAGEARLANRVLCTSGFVRRTLLDAGISADRIAVVPYGTRPVVSAVAKSAFSPEPSSATMRLAFVGQYVIRKGVHELSRFAQAHPEIEIVVFSREAEEARAVTKGWLGEVPPNVKFRRILEDHMLWQEALACDFLVLPSLAEGFGLVIAEAMSQGLPVIATRNSSAPDLLVDGISGFLMDDFFDRDLARAVERALERQAEWPQIREAARAATEPYTWAKFRQGILDLLPADDR